MGGGGRPKQHANIRSARADIDKKAGDEQAQREKRCEPLVVFVLERARPAGERQTQHYEAGNPPDEIANRVHLRPEQQRGKQRWHDDQPGPRHNFKAGSRSIHIA